MPTTPPLGLLEREIQKAKVREILNETEPVLKEIVHYGLALYARCTHTAKRGDENLPILLSYLHLLEMLDAIQVLVSEASIIPSRLQLRSMFEAILTIEYIIKDDSVRRAYAYLVSDINDRLRVYRSLDPKTAVGRDLIRKKERDNIGADMPLLEFPDLAERIEDMEKLLQESPWCYAQEEYLRIRREKNRKPRWHEFYEGPATIEELAIQLNRGFQYEILYRPWSKTAHVADIIRSQILPGEAGEASVRGLRDTGEILDIISFSISFFLAATLMILRHYRPGEKESFAAWYVREVRPIYAKLIPSLPPLEEKLGLG